LRSKLLTGAVAASATLALAAGAVAQVSTPTGDATLDVTTSPSKSGTKKKPRNVKLRFKQTVRRPGTTVGTIEVNLPKGLKFSGRGFKKCSAAKLLAGGPRACPSGSKAGPKGEANALIEPGNPPAPLDFDVYPFVENSKTFAIYLSQQGGGVQSVVKGKLSNDGRRMRISIPFELRQPAPGLNATLTGIDQTFSGKRGGNYIVSSTRCSGRKWAVNGTLIFSSRSDNAPVPGRLSLTENVGCRK
jgi:hypothetical protein